MVTMKALLLALLAQTGAAEWSSDFDASLKKARDGEVVLCVAVVDGTAASHDTLRSFDTDAVRLPASKFVKVKAPVGSKEAQLLRARWAPTIFLFRGFKEPPTPKDQACLKTLRETRMDVNFQRTRLKDVLSFVREFGKLQFRIDRSFTSAQKIIDLKKTNEPLGDVIRGAAEAVGEDYAVIDGVVVLAAKDKLRELRLRRDLDLVRLGRLEGLPELTEDDRRVTELLRRRIDLDLRGADRIKDAVARLNEALGKEVIQAEDTMARAFIGETRFKNCSTATILKRLKSEPKFVWYQKGGKVVLSEKPELEALTAQRIRSFIVESVECEESLLPEGWVKEIEELVVRLASDDPDDREMAMKGLKEWVQRSATSKSVLRRLLAGSSDAEVRARINAIVSVKRTP